MKLLTCDYVFFRNNLICIIYNIAKYLGYEKGKKRPKIAWNMWALMFGMRQN